MDQNEIDYYEQMQSELQDAQRDRRSLANTQLSMFGLPNDENLIKWQLDFKEDLDRIYHLLKGHKIKEDEEGNLIYTEQEDVDLIPFNEFGVQLIMNLLSFYLNRNTILSNYDNETIDKIMHDFGITLADLIHNRYHEIFLTTTPEEEFKKLYGIDAKITYDNEGNDLWITKVKDKEGKEEVKIIPEAMVLRVEDRLNQHLLGKISMYDTIVWELIHSVHSAYLRALFGGERRSLREARSVTQTENPLIRGMQQNIPVVSQQKSSKWYNPFSWGRSGGMQI